jgi:hypothetical protein
LDDAQLGLKGPARFQGSCLESSSYVQREAAGKSETIISGIGKLSATVQMAAEAVATANVSCCCCPRVPFWRIVPCPLLSRSWLGFFFLFKSVNVQMAHIPLEFSLISNRDSIQPALDEEARMLYEFQVVPIWNSMPMALDEEAHILSNDY